MTRTAGFIEVRLLALSTSHLKDRRRSKALIAAYPNPVLNEHRFADFAMHRVRMLQHFGVIPYLVFDGDFLPGKATTEADRSRRRRECRRAGLELLKLGKTAQAHSELQKAIDITPQMAGELIEDLKHAGVKYLVAPYEADAQLAYMERVGIISGIISEDSDLLVFGAQCLLTKLDQYGSCVEINRADLTACRDISLSGWSDVEFRQMAILSGCDYLPSLSKMGLKTAYRLVRRYKTMDRIIRAMQLEGRFSVPDGYQTAFREAELTFLHQRVFCPLSNQVVMFTEPGPDVDEGDLLSVGKPVKADVAAAVARGDLHPATKEPLKIAPRPRESSSSRSKQSGIRPVAALSPKNEDLKRGVPINAFFKARRTPLAELDPNSFMPSASQRRLLDQQSGTSWPVRPVAAEFAAVGSAGVNPMPPSRRRLRTIESAMNDSSTSSDAGVRGVKRPRLCSTDDVASDGPRSEVSLDAQSPFFGTSDTRSCGPKTHTRCATEEEISIYREVAEDRASFTPKRVELTVKRSKAAFTVFRDTDDGGVRQDSQCPHTATAKPQDKAVADARSSDLTASQTHNIRASNRKEHPGSHSRMLSVQHRSSVTQDILLTSAPSLTDRFGFKPPDRPIGILRARSTTLKAVGGGHTETRPSTPLQRIGAAALTRAEALQVKPRMSVQVDVSQARAAVEGTTTATTTTSTGLNRFRGSEDLMIPDSEGDEE